MFRPIGSFIARFLNRLQPLPKEELPEKEQNSRQLSPRRIVNIVLVILLIVLVLLGLWGAIQLLVQVQLTTWGSLLLAAFVTWLRTLARFIDWSHLDSTCWRSDRTFTPLVTSFATRCTGSCFYPRNSCLSGALTGTDSLPAGLNIAALLLMLLGTQWYILFNVIAGAMSIPSDLREATTMYHVLSWRRWRTLILPAIFPYLITGLLTASGGAWNASIVSEYVQFNGQTYSIFGLGASIAEAAAGANYPVLLAGTLLMSAFVVIINRLAWKRLYALAERRYTLD